MLASFQSVLDYEIEYYGEFASFHEALARLEEMELNLGFDSTGARKTETPPDETKGASIKEEAGAEENIASDSDNIKFDKINRAWPAILKQMRIKKMSAASFLLEASPMEFKNSTCIIGFPKGYSFHKENLENEDNRRFLEEILSQVLNEETRAGFIVSETLERRPLAEEREGPGAEKPIIDGGDKGQFSDATLVKSALDLFNGRIIEK